jgi:hypothetical protein
MKEIKTVNELLNVIMDRKAIFHVVGGKRYSLHIVRVLQTPLGDLIQQVKDGLLFYDVSND